LSKFSILIVFIYWTLLINTSLLAQEGLTADTIVNEGYKTISSLTIYDRIVTYNSMHQYCEAPIILFLLSMFLL